MVYSNPARSCCTNHSRKKLSLARFATFWMLSAIPPIKNSRHQLLHRFLLEPTQARAHRKPELIGNPRSQETRRDAKTAGNRRRRAHASLIASQSFRLV